MAPSKNQSTVKLSNSTIRHVNAKRWSNRKLVIEAVVCAKLWMIWRYRNDVAHKSRIYMGGSLNGRIDSDPYPTLLVKGLRGDLLIILSLSLDEKIWQLHIMVKLELHLEKNHLKWFLHHNNPRLHILSNYLSTSSFLFQSLN
ncbi:hypothetical protein LXL04_021797 [Taraxacum kok-saghyz]